MPLPALGAIGGVLGSLFGGGSQATANNSFQSTLSVTPVISIGGSVGAENFAGGTSDASATPTFSQSATPAALGGILGAPPTTSAFTSGLSPDLSASFQTQNSSLPTPLILGGIGLVGAAIFFFGGK